jgi:micrococcal nuclease
MKEYIYRATITKVVDGDTVYADVDLGFHTVTRVKFRLSDIDTWEIYSYKTPEELKLGQEAKLYVEKLCLGKEFLIKTYKTGKYGRWLVTIRLDDGVTLAHKLREAGYEKII